MSFFTEWLRSFALGRFVLALAKEAGDDDLGGIAAEMAYRFLFALMPLLLLLVTAAGFVGQALGIDDLVARALAQMRFVVPDAMFAVIRSYTDGLTEDRSGAFLTVGLIGTIWGTSAGVAILIKGLNRAYDVETPRPGLRRQLLALGVAVSLPIIAIAGVVLTSVGRAASDALAAALGLGDTAVGVFSVLQFVLVAALFLIGMSLAYWKLPAIRVPYRAALPGALFTTLAMLALTAGFGLYLRFASPDQVAQATFGAAVAFLLWLYLVSIVILLGAEINALLQPRAEARAQAAAA